MPATSSAPGAQPEAVAKKNQKAAAKATSAAVKSAAKSTAKAVSTSTAITEAASSVAPSVARGTSAPAPKGSSRPRSGRRSRPEPPLEFYKPPKPIRVKIKTDLKAMDEAKAQRAARKPIRVSAALKPNVVDVRKNKTVVSQSVAQKAAKTLPPTQQKQVAQKLKRQAPQAAPKPKKPERAPKAQRQRVRAKLTKAAEKAATSDLDRKFSEGETITPKQAALLAEAQGLPGKTYAQIAKGESGYVPTAVGTDPGGTHGLGLWQMTPGVQSRETKKAWDAIAKEHPGGYKNPVANAEMAKVLAGDGTGVSNYYGTGYMTDENAHLPGGPAKAQAKLAGEPIPKALKEKAQGVLGNSKTRKVIARAQSSSSTGEAPKQLPGKYAGSQRAIIDLLPKAVRPEARGDKRTPAENAAVGGAAGSDHLTTNETAYGADIDPDPKVYADLRKKLGLPPASTGMDTVTKDGYRYQLIFGAQYGHDDHIHIGAVWTGEGSTTPVSSSGSASGPPTAATGGSSTAPSGEAATQSRGKSKKSKKRRKVRAPQGSGVKLTALPAQLDASDYEFDPSVESYAEYVKRAPVRVSV